MNIVLLESLGVPEEVLNACAKPLVDAGHTFKAYPKDTDPKVQIERAKDADVIMIANMPLSGEVIRACRHLKYNAAGYSNEAVAELTLCMMLALLRNVPQVEARCRAGQTKDGLVGVELMGKTVGIVGVGAIGTRTAELCHAFGCKVLGNKRHVRGDEPDYIEFVSLEELLSRSDIVSLHCPLNEDSRGMINKDTIAKMKPGALLINAARGPVVDSQALADALNNGDLGGAGIDVFETEPPLDLDHPLLHSKNTIVTPHVAFASAESMETRCKIVFDNISQWMNGHQTNIIL